MSDAKTCIPDAEVQKIVAEEALFTIAHELRLIRLEIELIRKKMHSPFTGGGPG